jgi:hypothetical protein
VPGYELALTIGCPRRPPDEPFDHWRWVNLDSSRRALMRLGFRDEGLRFGELAARVRAPIRRGGVDRPTVLRVGDLVLDPASRRAWRGDDELTLSTKEFALLETVRGAGYRLRAPESFPQATTPGP